MIPTGSKTGTSVGQSQASSEAPRLRLAASDRAFRTTRWCTIQPAKVEHFSTGLDTTRTRLNRGRGRILSSARTATHSLGGSPRGGDECHRGEHRREQPDNWARTHSVGRTGAAPPAGAVLTLSGSRPTGPPRPASRPSCPRSLACRWSCSTTSVAHLRRVGAAARSGNVGHPAPGRSGCFQSAI